MKIEAVVFPEVLQLSKIVWAILGFCISTWNLRLYFQFVSRIALEIWYELLWICRLLLNLGDLSIFWKNFLSCLHSLGTKNRWTVSGLNGCTEHEIEVGCWGWLLYYGARWGGQDCKGTVTRPWQGSRNPVKKILKI